jgi:hypothetical protein
MRSAVRGVTSLRERLTEIGAEIRGAAAALAESSGGAGCRPSDLRRALGLDKSIAGRLLRVARATDPIEALAESPAQLGLRLVADALVVSGDHELSARFERAAAAYAELVDSLGGTRSELDVLLSGFLPRRLRRATLAAQQSIFRGMTHVHGCSTERHELQFWYAANRDHPDRADFAWFNSCSGLRVFRSAGPLIIGGAVMINPDDGPDPRLNLGGLPAGNDPRQWLVSDLCDLRGIEPITLSRPPMNLLMLPRDATPLAEPLSYTLGMFSVGAMSRHSQPDIPYQVNVAYPRIPAETLRISLFVDRELGWGEPRTKSLLSILPLGMQIATPDDLVPDLSAQVDDHSRVDGGLPAEVQRMRPESREVARRLLSMTRWDPERFEAWRISVDYPIPLVSVHTWFKLPPGDAG